MSGTQPILPQALSANYPDASVRGRMRTFKADLLLRYGEVDRIWRSDASHAALIEFCGARKSKVSRQRLLHRMCQTLGPDAVLEGACLTGREPLALWSVLRPRHAVRVDEADRHGAVVVEYMAGYAKDGGVHHAEGLWTVEIGDHALGRSLSGRLAEAPGKIVRDIHRALLRLPVEAVAPGRRIGTERRFLLRSGRGGFVCALRPCLDVSLNYGRTFSVFAHSWIDEDMAHDADLIIPDPAARGERLGESLLLPARMCLFDGDGAVIAHAWSSALDALRAGALAG